MVKTEPALRFSWHRAGDSTEEETEPRAGTKRSFTLTDEKAFEGCRDGSLFPVRTYHGGLGQECTMSV